jgi:subtilisin family serine protease
MRIKITTTLNTRIGGPHTTYRKGVVRQPGDVLSVQGTVTGENIGGNATWYRAGDLPDSYYWSGGAVPLDLQLPPFPIDYAAMFTGLGTDGEGIRVCLLDTGYEDHYAFQGKIKVFSDLTGGNCLDRTGHGTQLAGIIGAQFRHPDLPVVGLAPGCDLLVGKVIPDVSGGDNDARFIIAGIDWAIARQADIINLSFDIRTGHLQILPALQRAADAGILLVAAAGDVRGLDGGAVSFPASDFAHCISVGSVSGSYLETGPHIHPRINYLSGWVRYLSTSLSQYGYFAELKGSSIAAAFVTGLCARILSGLKRTGNYPAAGLKEVVLSELDRITVPKDQLNFTDDSPFKLAKP